MRVVGVADGLLLSAGSRRLLCVHLDIDTMDWNHIYCFLPQKDPRWRSWMLLSSFSRNKRLHFWNAGYYQSTVQTLGRLVSTSTDPSLPGNSAGITLWDVTVEIDSKSMCIITYHNSGYCALKYSQLPSAWGLMVDIQIFLINVLDVLLTPFPKMPLDYNACAFPHYRDVELDGGRKAAESCHVTAVVRNK